MKTILLKIITFLIGSVTGAILVLNYTDMVNVQIQKKHPEIIEVIVPQVVEVSNKRVESGVVEKTCVRTFCEVRIYAEDGSYMIPSVTEFIDTKVDDTITSSTWIFEK